MRIFKNILGEHIIESYEKRFGIDGSFYFFTIKT